MRSDVKAFLDTNILVYSVDRTDAKKNAKAVSIVQTALRQRTSYAISVQCLSEFANVALRKIELPPDAVLDFVRMFKNINTIIPDCDLVSRGVEIKALYGIQYYDAMMVAAAERVKAREIWSEDLNPGQRYCGILAVDPFL
ncbi:MAG: PIN domain-containing protein [Kiritimatiellae bacterium]|nr:PIN domain-containing protein [Kiritimatiellia bacterium]